MPRIRKETMGSRLNKMSREFFPNAFKFTLSNAFQLFVPADPRRVFLYITPITGTPVDLVFRLLGTSLPDGFTQTNQTAWPMIFTVETSFSFCQLGLEGKCGLINTDILVTEIIYRGG